MASSINSPASSLPFLISCSLLIILFFQSITLAAGANSGADRAALTVAEFLDGHNAARKAVGVPAVRWDKLLARYAKVYSNQRRHGCELVHSPGYAFGENIFWGMGHRWRVADIMAAWVGERRWYHYGNNSCSGDDCTHYTQIVWRTTQRVGCARIVCDSGDTFAACEYYPPGNYIGARPY